MSIHRKLPFWIGIPVGVRLQKGGKCPPNGPVPGCLSIGRNGLGRERARNRARTRCLWRVDTSTTRRLAVSGRRHSRALRQVGSAKQAAESAAVPWGPASPKTSDVQGDGRRRGRSGVGAQQPGTPVASGDPASALKCGWVGCTFVSWVGGCRVADDPPRHQRVERAEVQSASRSRNRTGRCGRQASNR